MTEMLEYILPIFSASNMFFFWYIQGTINNFTILGLVIGIVHAFLPMQKLNKKIFTIKDSVPNEVEFNDAKNNFDTDYARSNPATA